MNEPLVRGLRASFKNRSNQQEVVGENIPDYYISLEYAAWASLSLTSLNVSVRGQARATTGLYQTIGPTNKNTLGAKCYKVRLKRDKDCLIKHSICMRTRGRYGQQ